MEIPAQSKLRVARPTDRLEEVVQFHLDNLGFAELGRFGWITMDLTGPSSECLERPYHLEFTYCRKRRRLSRPGMTNGRHQRRFRFPSAVAKYAQTVVGHSANQI
jgi:hypothetical protein